jgi:aminocarboxymuconate-semialdehyde decarboxylase
MPPLIDIHTHIYPPSYIALLQSRKTVPYIHTPTSPPAPHRLIILPSDDNPSIPLSSRGRPLDSSYSSLEQKLAFMDAHQIRASVISLANPWLDFLDADSAAKTAREINDEMLSLSAQYPGRIYAFGTLPLSAPVEDIVAEIHRLASPEVRKGVKGIILGTSGFGKGLDDQRLDEVWRALDETQLLVFLHPHYGLPGEVFGPRASESGHVLPLAMGFPLETTIAFTRMFLVGVFDRFPNLRILLAHAGGAFPFLAGRVESCIAHERAFLGQDGKVKRGRKVWEVLKENIWLDGVVYADVGVKAAVDCVGKERVLWGTDHPFFPPIETAETGEEEWLSVKLNIEAVEKAFASDREGADGVLGLNAIRLLDLDVKE